MSEPNEHIRPPISQEVLPESLWWRRRWVADPIPEWWMKRLDERVIKELLAVQVEADMRMMELQQQALKVKMEEMQRAARILGQ